MKKKQKSYTWLIMEQMAQNQVGTTMFCRDDWHHWFFEAAERYGFQMELVRFVKGGVWFKIVALDRPEWFK